MLKLAWFILVFSPIAVFAQDSGPAVLSRGEVPGTDRPDLSFRPFLEAAWTYGTSVSELGVDSEGGRIGSSGIQISAGLSGAHSWRKTTLGLGYRGSIDHYAKAGNYNSYDQSLQLSLSQQLTRHAVLTLKESAGMFSRNFGLSGEALSFGSVSSGSMIGLFDRKMEYLESEADLTLQASNRLSFSLGAQGNLTRRRTTGLYGVTGGGANADVQYRASRRSTFGLNYSYNYFAYRGVKSNTSMHGLAGTYSVKLSRSLEFSILGGALRSENFTSQDIRLDPIMAWLFGTSTVTAVSYHVDYVPNVSARLSEAFRHANFSLSGGRTVTPGNGLFLTSIATNVYAGYEYTGLRRWSLGLEAGYSRNKSIGNVVGYYGNLSAGGSMARQIARYVHAVASVECRRYDSSSFQRYNRLDYYARVGLAFAPGDAPLRLWP